MTETQRRIEAYQKALPGIREKVTAVAMLLALSVIMLTSASFAWLTISRAPEVSSVATNVAANGNLEIALAKPDGSVPAESNVGDSFAAEGNNIVAANITWGNLINLNDPSYGLENITLRPALMNTANNLLKQPLKGANYGVDGRVELYYNDKFEFTSWNILDDGSGRFDYMNPTRYGVRAISTIEEQRVGDQIVAFYKVFDKVEQKKADTEMLYNTMVGNDTYIDALAAVIGQFMTDKLNESNTDIQKHVPDLYDMLIEFEGAVRSYEDVMLILANSQIFIKFGKDEYSSHTYSTTEELLNAKSAELSARGVSLESLAKYKSVYKETMSIIYGDGIHYGTEEYTSQGKTPDCFTDYYNMATAKQAVYLKDMQGLIDRLVNINKCQIICEGTTYTVGNLGMSAATQLLGKDVDAVITAGVLKDFEQLSGCKICATNVTVTAKYMITVNMTAKTITTNAGSPFIYDKDYEAIANKIDTLGQIKKTSQDTYGMAVDYWVRTNAEGTHLILQGNVLTETTNEREIGVDKDGKEVQLYTVTITTTYTTDDGKEESISDVAAVYAYTSENGGTEYRNANTHSVVINADGSSGIQNSTVSTPIERFKEVTVVVGYEGENRVWNDNEFIDADSTTQGNGSCYIFYAEDPGQQEYCIRLLSNLRVAFLDANAESATYGKMVAIAKLDIDKKYEKDGKVTLPLVLVDDGSPYITETTATESGLAICALEKNTPTMLTTVIYLNGTDITNSDVLSANDIQGQLNIQFGTTEELEPIRNEELEIETRSAVVVATTDPANYPESNSVINFNFDEDDNMKVYLRLKTEGSEPSMISGFFMRRINDFQGSREKTFDFTKGEDGFWYGEYTFDAPGSYVLKTVQLDGMDYTLAQTEATQASGYPQVEISGFNIKSLNISYEGYIISEHDYTIMTGNQNAKMDIDVSLADSKKEPSSVRLQFIKDDGTQVFTTLSKDSTSQSWKGTVNFTTSGTYELKNIIIDGEYDELDLKYQHLFELILGMKVEVNHMGGEISGEFGREETSTVQLNVKIYDNTGEEVKYLSGAKLRYGRSTTDNFETDLKWDSADNRYETNLVISKPGIWKFVAVKVGENAITQTVNASPTYTRISPNPVAYDSAIDIPYSYYVDGNPERLFGIKAANAEAATATIELTNGYDGKIYYVDASADSTDENGISTFYFNLKNAVAKDGTKAADGLGKWKAEKVSLINVFSGEGENSVLHEEENPFVIDNAAIKALEAELVSLKVSVTNNEANTGIENETLDGETLFMSSETADRPIRISITDHRGNALKSENVQISNPTVTYKYTTKSSLGYGGYIGETDGPSEDIELTTGTSSDGKTFETNKIELSYAGEYIAYLLSFNLTVNGEEKTVQYTTTDYGNSNPGVSVMEMPKYYRKTENPTVAITAISPTGTINVDPDNNVNKHTSITVPGFSATNATVYFSCGASQAGSGSTCSPVYHNYTRPSVTITLAKIGNATQAELSFGSNVHVYNGTTKVTGYTWTANGAVVRNIGYFKSATMSTDDKTGAGTITASTLVLTYNNVKYSFTVPTITINNPY